MCVLGHGRILFFPRVVWLRLPAMEGYAVSAGLDVVARSPE